MAVDCKLNHAANHPKGNSARNKRLDGDFVGCVQNGTERSAALLATSYANLSAGNRFRSGGSKFKENAFAISILPAASLGTVRIRQRILNRRPHIRRRKLRNH